MSTRAPASIISEKKQGISASLKDRLHARLVDWFDVHQRKLPWRTTKDPYAIWLSEVMAQQTRVETVIPYYEKFLAAYPTVHHLAEAPLEGVLGLWSGLGYYRRARMLHRTAGDLCRSHSGRFPRTKVELETLSGIGPYTAGAIASIAFREPASVVDGNVVRVLARIFNDDADGRTPAGLGHFRSLADALIHDDRPGDWNQALMELGATVCTPREPACGACPVSELCEGRRAGPARDLPRLTKKPKPIPVAYDALVAAGPGRVLLAERSHEGLFGGLLEPPLFDANPTLSEAAFTAGMSLTGALGTVHHTLSHRKFSVAVHCATQPIDGVPALPLSPAYVAFHLVAWPLPEGARVSTLARKILAFSLET